jgi:YVTN family beta-propeller protein
MSRSPVTLVRLVALIVPLILLGAVTTAAAQAPRAEAATGADPVAFVSSPLSTVTPVDTVTGTAGSPITVPESSYPNIAITPNGEAAYVDGYQSPGSVTPIDTTSDTAGTPIKTFGSPDAIAATPNDNRVYEVSYGTGTIKPIYTATNKVGKSITVGGFPSGIAITPNGKWAYVAEFGNPGSVVPVNLDSGTVGTPIPVGIQPGAGSGIAVTPNGKTVYVANNGSDSVTPIDTASNTAGTPIALKNAPFGIAIAPDGQRAYVCSRLGLTPINLVTNAPGTTIKIADGCMAVAIAPNGQTAYVAGLGKDIMPVDLATKELGSSTALSGDVGVGDLAITPDQAPTAVFSATPAPAGSPTGFDASASVAPSSPITKYAWSFGDGTTASTTVPTVSHTYADPGTYTVTLTLTDAAGTSTSRVFTGQTMSRNGGPQARTSQTVTIPS